LRLTLASAGVVLVAGTSACSGLGGADDTDTTRTGATVGSGGTTSVATVPGQPRDPSLDERTVVASRTGGYDDVNARIDLISVRRSGSLATLRFTATNTSSTDPDDYEHEWRLGTDLGAGPGEYAINGIYLVDPAHSKKYPTATDSGDDCVCSSTSGVSIAPSTSREFSATFAAPPADVNAVDVYVPGAGTFENVPVS
jgi:hypothetical protein